MSNKDDLIKLIKNQSIIETNPSINGLSEQIIDYSGSSVYLGTGLCTAKQLSKGLPFDILGMILTAETIRRKLNMKNVYHQIADVHAVTNQLFPLEDIQNLTKIQLTQIEQVLSHLELTNYHVYPASQVSKQKSYQKVLDNINTKTAHEYRKRELADIEWHRTERDVTIKVGWTISGGNEPSKYDERSYDELYQSLIGNPMSFIYVKAGRTLNPQKPKASPYITTELEERLILKPNESVERKINLGQIAFKDKNLGGVKKYLNDILRIYQSLMGRLESKEIEQKVKEIIDGIYKTEKTQKPLIHPSENSQASFYSISPTTTNYELPKKESHTVSYGLSRSTTP